MRVRLGQGAFAGGASPDTLPYDSTLQANPGAALKVNRGCPAGYFVLFTANGPVCRLLATSTPETVQQETGITWGETASIYTSAIGDTARQVGTVVAAVPSALASLGQGLLWAVGGLAALLALAWFTGRK